MDGGNRRHGSDSGGIISLARIVQKHEAALDYDLQTRAGRTLGEYLDMGAAGKVALCHFVRYLDADSTTAREAGGLDAQEWSTTFKTNAVLADLYDAVSWLTYVTIAKDSKTKPKKPKPYPRPWLKGEVQKFGKAPVKISEFWDWWKSKE